jgi:hypothetical protein
MDAMQRRCQGDCNVKRPGWRHMMVAHGRFQQHSDQHLPAARADAGSVRLGGRDVTGLVLVGDMCAPHDLLAGFLAAQPALLLGIVARWRHPRVRRYRAAGRWAGLVLADPLWPGRDRAALRARPARAGPAGPRPRRLSGPPQIMERPVRWVTRQVLRDAPFPKEE